MKRISYKYAGLFLILALFAGCMKEPVYPNEPQIEFNSIHSEIVKNSLGNVLPRIFIKLNFKDGDGNLGLNTSDLANAPFNDTVNVVNGVKIIDRTKARNYFVKAFFKKGNQFVPYPNLVSKEGYRFLRLDPDNKKHSLEGELDYYLDVVFPIDIDFPEYESGDSVKFEIYVVDRSLNKSNIIQTAPVAVFDNR